jgi:class 3 adenylate cyclase/tetratricopeptide (TPR) repeat protein
MSDLDNISQESLRPYLPRLLIQWLCTNPSSLYQEVEGSIAFVDISGFTKLSERLAKKGKVGAEELTEAIGTCFTRLLSVAYANGGGLIKFGGDALLLLFTGADHPARAAAAAVGMRRELREMGSLASPGGRVRLRMSVGVHSGVFHFFLVGESHRELMITGPAASETVAMEGTAEAGEIVASPAAASALPAAWLGSAKGDGFLLRKEPPGIVPERAPVDATPSAEQMLACIPRATREHVIAGLHELEHKRVTVAFIHFDRTDHLIAFDGLEMFAKALNDLVAEVQDAADRHGVCFLGTDIDRDGGKIILTAGAPTSSGNDEERMLLTLRQIIEREHGLPIRIGVNRGHVFAGDIGPFYRRTYTVMGDAVNLAARLMAKAQPGEIVATEPVLQPSRTKFETVPMEPFMVKGKAQPITAFRVGPVDRAAAVESESRGDAGSPLIGREKEMEALLTALTSARGGSGRIMEIVGEPGIGKSRLIEELKKNASDMTILAAACELYHASTPYSPLAGPLRGLFGIGETDDAAAAAERIRGIVVSLVPHLAAWLPLLGILLDIPMPSTPAVDQLGDEFRRQRLEEVTVELLSEALTEPTLFVFEDTHWMDEASSDLIHRLSADLANKPWFLCLTRRDVSEGFSSRAPLVEVLHPQPLDVTAAAALVDAATEEMPLSPHEISALAERSGGNPLFLKELLAAARAAGGIEGLPDSVEAVITARIDRLPPRERTILRRLSVLGPAFRGELARAVVPPELLTDEAAWERVDEFIEDDGEDTLRFRHALIRDAAYEGLPYRLRQELHALVGETIEREAGSEAEEHAEILSLHFFNARRYEASWRYSRVAAERAGTIYANVDAADFLERAIESARREAKFDPVDVAGVYESLGEVRKRIGEYGPADAAYAKARRLVAGDPVAVSRLLQRQGTIRTLSARYPEALRWFHRARKWIEDVQGDAAAKQRAQIAVALAGARTQQGRAGEAVRWGSIAVTEAEKAEDKDALAHAYFVLDNAYVLLGDYDKATYSQRALELYNELGDLWGQGVVLNNLGVYAAWRGQWNEALDLYEQGRQAREKIGDAVNAAYGTVNIGEILSDQGRLDEAEPLIRKALRVWKAAGFRHAVVYATSALGRLTARRGDYDEAMRLLEEASAEAEDIGAQGDGIEADARIAECLALQARSQEALEVADRTLERARSSPRGQQAIPVLERVRAWAFIDLGRLEQAVTAFQESLRSARERNLEYEVALTQRGLAKLTSGEESETLERESRLILERLGVVAVAEPAQSSAAMMA